MKKILTCYATSLYDNEKLLLTADMNEFFKLKIEAAFSIRCYICVAAYMLLTFECCFSRKMQIFKFCFDCKGSQIPLTGLDWSHSESWKARSEVRISCVEIFPLSVAI
jgi:hypothetical protein